jgi:hypothetical protein
MRVRLWGRRETARYSPETTTSGLVQNDLAGCMIDGSNRYICIQTIAACCRCWHQTASSLAFRLHGESSLALSLYTVGVRVPASQLPVSPERCTRLTASDKWGTPWQALRKDSRLCAAWRRLLARAAASPKKPFQARCTTHTARRTRWYCCRWWCPCSSTRAAHVLC